MDRDIDSMVVRILIESTQTSQLACRELHILLAGFSCRTYVRYDRDRGVWQLNAQKGRIIE